MPAGSRALVAIVLLGAVAGCGQPASEARTSEPAPTAAGGEDTTSPPPPTCTGSIDVAAVVAELRLRDDGVRDCYEAELRTEPTWQVTIHVEITLVSSGEIDTISFEPVGHPGFEACVPAVLAGASFPPLTGGSCAVISAPYVFTPSS